MYTLEDAQELINNRILPREKTVISRRKVLAKEHNKSIIIKIITFPLWLIVKAICLILVVVFSFAEFIATILASLMSVAGNFIGGFFALLFIIATIINGFEWNNLFCCGIALLCCFILTFAAGFIVALLHIIKDLSCKGLAVNFYS